jgi:hypothetical protein
MIEATWMATARNWSRAAVRSRVSKYLDAQRARLLEHVSASIARYQQGAADTREVNRVIEHYYEAEQALSRWANGGPLEAQVAFLDGADAEGFDWWNAPERERSIQLNAALADQESRDRERSYVRWPWSKVQRSDSSKG